MSLTLMLLRNDYLQLVLLSGYLDLYNLTNLEVASSKWHFYVLGLTGGPIKENAFKLVYDFSNNKCRRISLHKQIWFNRRSIYILDEMMLTGFDDLSCWLGRDIMAENISNVVRFTISNSFRHITCGEDSLHRRQVRCDREDEFGLINLINRLGELQLKHLCFNCVPTLWWHQESMYGLRELMTLKIVNCLKATCESVLGFLNYCYNLEVFHYITDEKEDSIDDNDPQVNSELVMIHLNTVCKKHLNVYISTEAAVVWGIDINFVNLNSERITFCLFDSIDAYFAMHDDLIQYDALI